MASPSIHDGYRHIPLETSRSIRVLRIEPAPNFSDPIHCSIWQISIDTSSEPPNAYTALSYVWGAPHGTEEIFCDNKTLLITPNCEAVLRALRGGPYASCLWIDALCINQKDDEESLAEKNHQVRLMGEVYRRAKLVLVWLGAVSEPRVAFLKCAEQIGNLETNIGTNAKLVSITRLYQKWRLKKYWVKLGVHNGE